MGPCYDTTDMNPVRSCGRRESGNDMRVDIYKDFNRVGGEVNCTSAPYFYRGEKSCFRSVAQFRSLVEELSYVHVGEAKPRSRPWPSTSFRFISDKRTA